MFGQGIYGCEVKRGCGLANRFSIVCDMSLIKETLQDVGTLHL